MRARILRAVRETTLAPSPVSLPQALRQLGDALLEQAKSGLPTRDTALTLLAADTLVTLAYEVVAEENPDELGWV